MTKSDDLPGTMYNLLNDFKYSFEDLSSICQSINISVDYLEYAIDLASKGSAEDIASLDAYAVMRVIEEAEDVGIPIRPVGLEIRTYEQLKAEFGLSNSSMS